MFTGMVHYFQTLAETCQNLHDQKFGDPFFVPVHKFILNPKAITMGELYGEVNTLTLEWKDGLMAMTVRIASQVCATLQDSF